MSNPFALSPYTFSSSNERKGSEELGPDEVAPSNNNYTPLESQLSKDRGSLFPWRTTGHDQLTYPGPEEPSFSTNEIVKPSPTHQSYTPADRKSMTASLQDVRSASPFSDPSYDRLSSANRLSANLGPHYIDTNSSPFSRLSYGSPSKANRISTNIAPDEIPTTQHADLTTNNRNSTSISPNELTSIHPAFRIQKSLGPGDWESSNISPGAANVTTTDHSRQPLANNYAAGGVIDSTNPFFTSTNPFADRSGILKTTSRTEQLPFRTPGAGFGSRGSRNFSKKIPSITVPENGVSFDRHSPAVESPISPTRMKDTPMQTPTGTSFASVYERKKSRSNSVAFAGLAPPLPGNDTRSNSVAFTDLSPLTSRQPSASTVSRRTSTANPPSAAASRRPSLAAPRRSSISVTNVVIPAHLMTHVETNWNEDKIVGRRKSAFQREDSRKSFNIQAMAQQQQEEVKNIINRTQQAPRYISPSMEALAQADPFAAMRNRQASARRPRGKSLAAVDETEKGNDDEEEEEDSDEQPSPSEPPEGLSLWGKSAFDYRDGGISPGAAMDPADPLAAAGAALGLVTSNTNNISNIAARRPSMWRHNSAVDGSTPYNGQRRPSVLQRAGSVFQDTMQTVRKKVRRSSMWDVYENAKKRQLEIRRKRWVQLVFEYFFYFMLLVIFYFLIIGEPLWKGTYLSLYLAFKYKLNLNGSWSIIIAVAAA
jgi:hypothetical protein